MNAQNLVAWLPFDESTTQDLCGNTWTIEGTEPTIQNQAIDLTGNTYIYTSSPTLGSLNFTIHWWEFIPSSQDSFWRDVVVIDGTTGTHTHCLDIMYDSTNYPVIYLGRGKSVSSWTISRTSVGSKLRDQWVHRAIVRSGSTIFAFENGNLFKTISFGDYAVDTSDSSLFIGGLRRGGTQRRFIGQLSNFMFHVGIALWTENFTPPTAADYLQLRLDMGLPAPFEFDADIERKLSNAVEVTFDAERKLKWRYENAGTADTLIIAGTTLTDLPESKSVTGTAFYQTTRAKCFDLPATDEVWLKFDVYFDGSNRWRAYNTGSNGSSGICSQTNGNLDFWANGSNVYTLANGAAKNQLQTVFLHMVSGSSAGVVEAWIDGNFIYRYTGDVNHGEDFEDIYLQSDGAGTFFSNVLISNAEIDLGEGYQIFHFDSERRISKHFDFFCDVERRVKNIINVLFNADVLIQDVLPATLAADTERRVQRPFELDLDVEILEVFPVEFLLDVARNILAKIKLMDTDTSQYFSGDTSEPVVIPSQIIPFAPDDSSTLQSLEISLSEQQLTDQVNFVTTAPFEIMQQFGGQYLDYQNQMRVETIRQDGILYSCSCCSDIDELLYTQFNYALNSGFVAFVPDYSTMTLRILPPYEETSETIIRKGKASAHLQKIAALLGASEVICNFDDFVSTMNERQSDVTYQDLISQLFGWTSRLPQKMINTFLRNGKLYAIQRGREEHVLDLSQADCSYPIYERRLIRTMWGSGKSGIIPTTEKVTISNKHTVPGHKVFPPPPSLSSDGKTSYVYHEVSGYGGIEHGYALTSTETRNDDGGRTIVDYFYDFVGGVYTCTSEQSRTYDEHGNKVDEHTTIHDRLTPSQQFSRMDDEDGNTIASNVGSNLPGFYNEWYWLSLPKEVGYEYDINKITGYNPLIDTEFPVLDADIYSQLIAAYAWLNRRTQETISFDVYDYPHLIDFNDRILLGGYEFYLVNNTALSNARIRNKQSLRLVRWF